MVEPVLDQIIILFIISLPVHSYSFEKNYCDGPQVLFCVCVGLPVQMHVEQIEVGGHFVSLARKFTSF